jgi:hypothetical protein
LRAGFVATGAFRRQNRLKFSRSSLERPPELPRKETYLRARVEELCIGPHPRVQELCTGPDAGAPALKVWRLVAFRAEAANAYSSFLESCGCVASTFQGGVASVPSHFLLVMGPEMISPTARRPSLPCGGPKIDPAGFTSDDPKQQAKARPSAHLITIQL